MKIPYIFYIGCICITLSCKNPKVSDQSIALIRSDLEVNFNDNALDSVIAEYVEKYKVDPKERVLSLKIYRDPIRQFYYLTQVRRKKLIEINLPDYFFIHDNRFIVLLQLGGSNYYTSSVIVSKLDSAMQKLGIVLPGDSLDYNPPLWELIKDCEGKLQMRQNSDFVFNYVPCGYEVKQDSLNLNDFSLMKQ